MTDMNRTRRPGGLCWLVLMALIVAAGATVPAAADHVAAPGDAAGSGSLAGTERVDDWDWVGAEPPFGHPCIKMTKSIFALRGVGTYHGRSAGGQDVVYRAETEPGAPLHANGPLQVGGCRALRGSVATPGPGSAKR